jgi:thiamine biosynthesis lipoprotein
LKIPVAALVDEGQALRFTAMAGDAEIRIVGLAGARAGPLLEAAAAEVRRIEAKYSRYREDSIVSRINAAAGNGAVIEVDTETASLLAFGDSLHAQSEGRFDLTSGILRRAWDFRSGRLPEAERLADLCARIGWSRVAWRRTESGGVIALPEPGMELDFGGIGKEYAADRAAGLLVAAGVPGGYVNLAGDLRVIGPRGDGRGWSLGIQHPREAGVAIASVELREGALATSGDYERYMEVAGRRYCHILDPRSGWPVQQWRSVSVIAPVCVAAGALCTIAMLMGEGAIAFLDAQRVPYLAVDADGVVHRSGL